jgi:hypothetical protein
MAYFKIQAALIGAGRAGEWLTGSNRVTCDNL